MHHGTVIFGGGRLYLLGGRRNIVVLRGRLLGGRCVDQIEIVSVQKLLFALSEQFFLFGKDALLLLGELERVLRFAKVVVGE